MLPLPEPSLEPEPKLLPSSWAKQHDCADQDQVSWSDPGTRSVDQQWSELNQQTPNSALRGCCSSSSHHEQDMKKTNKKQPTVSNPALGKFAFGKDNKKIALWLGFIPSGMQNLCTLEHAPESSFQS